MAKKRGRPFAPGTSGNPRGRPRREDCISNILRALGDEKIGPDAEHSRREILGRVIWRGALAGDLSMARWLCDKLNAGEELAELSDRLTALEATR